MATVTTLMKPAATARNPAVRSVRRRTDEQLAGIASDAWNWAAKITEPTRLRTRNRIPQRVLGVEEDANEPQTLRGTRQVSSLLLKGKRPRGAKGDHTRHWAVWRMMTQLLETSQFNDSRDGVVFPYPNPHAAAVAVVEGFRQSGLDTQLTANRVLRHYQRHFENR